MESTPTMETQHNLIKYYLLYLIDVTFAFLAFWDVLDHSLRTIAALGVIISTIYLIRKHKSEHDVNKEKKRLIEIERQIKEQELYDMMQKNKEK